MTQCNNCGGHKFPRGAKAKNAWVLAIKRGTEWVPTKSTVVCSDHFMKADYVTETYHGKLSLSHQILQPLFVGKISTYAIYRIYVMKSETDLLQDAWLAAHPL